MLAGSVMTLSSNVLKAQTVKNNAEPVRLHVGPNDMLPVYAAVAEAQKAAVEIVTRAQDEARAIIEGAEEEVGQIREQARREAHDQGLQEGRGQGRKEALAQWSKTRDQIQELWVKIEQLKSYTKLLEAELVLAQAAALTRTFIEEEGMNRPELLRQYLTQVVQSLEGTQITLFLSPEFHNTVKRLSKNWEPLWQEVELAVDRTLETLEMRLKTEGGDEFLAGPAAALTRILDEVLYGGQ